MTVAAYMALNGRVYASSFDYDRWGEIRYEGSTFHKIAHRVIQQLSEIGSWHHHWNNLNGLGSADFPSVGIFDMQFIICGE